MNANAPLRTLDSNALLERFARLVERDQRTTAAMLVHIAEIDRRELWAEKGYSSLFSFCVERFHMSESMAGKRIYAARSARKFPLVAERVARGELHLTGVCLLAKHLTETNHREVLARARHRTAREIERLVAELHPRPDVPSRVRALPRRPSHASAAPAELSARHTPPAEDSARHSAPLLERAEADAERAAARRPGAAGSPGATPADPARRRSRIEPLAPRRYKTELTVDEETHQKLRELQALLSHQVPSGDPSILIDRALDLLLERARKQRAGAGLRRKAKPDEPSEGAKPGEAKSDAGRSGPAESSRSRGRRVRSKSTGRSRAIPAHVRAQVWARDGGRCAYVSPSGKRCGETRLLQFHHLDPYARGGSHDVGNIGLRCRAHNQFEANRDYGRAFMERKRRRSGVRETLSGYARTLSITAPASAPAPTRSCSARRAASASTATRVSSSVARRSSGETGAGARLASAQLRSELPPSF